MKKNKPKIRIPISTRLPQKPGKAISRKIDYNRKKSKSEAEKLWEDYEKFKKNGDKF